MRNVPRLTVVLPAHNSEETIASAIQSTLQQTYKDFELWILENGSTDRTTEIAKGFTDPRVKIFELGPVGLEGAIQFAIENSRSEWLARMDADDLMFPDRLRIQMELLAQRPDLVLVGTAYALLTPFGHIFERISQLPSREINTAERNRRFADPSIIFRRSVALEAGGIDQQLKVGDLSLWLRILQRGKGWDMAKPLLLYRLRPQSMSRNGEFRRQGIQARLKYAPQTLRHVSEPQDAASSIWGWIGSLELLAGNRVAARYAAARLECEGSPMAKRLRWLSYFGRVGYGLYNWRYNGTGYQYKHRPDWEKAFAPLLAATREDSPSLTAVS
jgi:glycosyltransferase involved in cell wall biosynthesis